MQILDVVMIILFVVVLVIIVGLNIVSVIDRKIGNIEIIIPPLNQNYINSNISGKPVEGFNETPKYEIKNKEVNKTIEKELINKSETEKQPNIQNPDDSNVVEYGQYICYKKDSKNNVDKIQTNKVNNQEEKKICYNNSLNKKFAEGREELPSGVGCQLSWYDVDPANFFKKYKAPVIPIEDELIKGYNLGEFNTAGGINEVGRIELNNNKQRYAQPNNYILN